MKRTILLLLAAALLFSFSCEGDSQKRAGRLAPKPIIVASYTPQDEALQEGAGDKGIALATARPDQKLIRIAVLHIEVDDIEQATAKIALIVSGLGGLVADSQVTRGSEGGVSSHIVVRVPWTGFDAAVSELKELGRVGYERLETQDVTKDYVDLETRLAVKREAATRLRQMLSSRTGNLEELLAVERELSRVIEEIERHEARKRYFDRQVALSTITLQLTDHRTAAGPPILAPLGEAFGRAVEVLVFSVSTLVYVLTFLVPWLCLAAALWWLLRTLRRRQKRTQSR